MPQFSNTQQAVGQQVMVPQIISSKDIQYLKDQMSWLLLASKKCAHFAKESQDPEVRQAIEQIGQLHQRHYTQLMGHLSSQNNQASMLGTQPATSYTQNATRQ